LGDAGRLTEACAAAETAVEAHPLDAELRYLAATLLLEAGRLKAAAAAAAAAVYLEPAEPAAHLLLGQAHHAAGDLDRARRSFRNAARLLASAPGETPVALAAGMPAGHLAAVAHRYLDALAPMAEQR
jgi:Flp pilus assembly protein TadD